MEKRKFERIKTTIRALVDMEKSVKILDISKNGLRLKTNFIPKGDQIFLTISNTANTLFPITGNICWINKKPVEGNEIGVKIETAPFGFYNFIEELFSFKKPNIGLFFWPGAAVLVLLTTIALLIK